jgi:hypothetical protein
MIYQYQQVTDEFATHRLNAPEGSSELATVDGITYVHVPDGLELPAEQPEQIAASIAPATVDAELKAKISDTSPHVALIRARVAEKIAAQYSIGDEIKLLRTAPSAEFELYNAYVEDCRAWGRAQKAALGL